jgi:hypothetical protein
MVSQFTPSSNFLPFEKQQQQENRYFLYPMVSLQLIRTEPTHTIPALSQSLDKLICAKAA